MFVFIIKQWVRKSSLKLAHSLWSKHHYATFIGWTHSPSPITEERTGEGDGEPLVVNHKWQPLYRSRPHSRWSTRELYSRICRMLLFKHASEADIKQLYKLLCSLKDWKWNICVLISHSSNTNRVLTDYDHSKQFLFSHHWEFFTLYVLERLLSSYAFPSLLDNYILYI